MEAPAPAVSSLPYAHGGDRVAAALAAHGVRFLFTLCGGHIAPILVAAKARGIRIVDARDEATAVFAADAVARLTGKPGVAAVTAGPGVTNALTALENAKLAQSPLLLIGGAAPTALQGRGALQDIDQGPVVAPFVKWAKRVRRVRDLAPAVAEALAVAREGVPGPVFVECPVDLLYDEKTIREWYADAAGKGTSIADRLKRLYLERHAARLFAKADQAPPAAPRAVVAPSATEAQVEAAATRLTAADAAARRRRQPGAGRRRRPDAYRRGAVAARRAGLSFRHGARTARPQPSVAAAAPAPPGFARSRLRAARRRAL